MTVSTNKFSLLSNKKEKFTKTVRLKFVSIQKALYAFGELEKLPVYWS